MDQETVRRLAQEADLFNRHLLSVHARLKQQRITESRGAATVTLDGLGQVVDLTIEWVDPLVQDCVLAALRAAEGRAQAGYESYGLGNG